MTNWERKWGEKWEETRLIYGDMLQATSKPGTEFEHVKCKRESLLIVVMNERKKCHTRLWKMLARFSLFFYLFIMRGRDCDKLYDEMGTNG